MVERALVSSEIEAAKQLVAFLDENGFPVKAALWLYESEAERWRFVVSFQEKRENPLSFYSDVSKLFNEKGLDRGLLDLDRVNFVDADRSIVRSLAQNYRGLKSEGRHVISTRLPDVFVEEALILRLPA